MNAGFFFYLRSKNFFMKEESDEDWKTALLEGEREDWNQTKKMFKAQMSSYYCYTVILSVVQVIVILLGEVFIDKGGYLTCTGGGHEWLY